MPTVKIAPTMSDAAVQKATGKTWPQWFSLLDKAGAKKMTHQEIVRLLREKHAVGPWWQQMVTVTYEKARGLRKLHERPDGYQVSVGKTVPVPVDALFEAWHDPKRRRKWLPEKITIHRATAPKSVRFKWFDGTPVDVRFYAKGVAKSTLSLSHGKLPSAKGAAAMKQLWKERLTALADQLG